MEELPAPVSAPRRRRLLAKFTGAAMVGFVVSAIVLHFGLEAGLRPWLARLIALACAMNLTFLINGRFVFGGVTRRSLPAKWAGYMLNSAVGNVCNYWVFVTLESTHRPVIGDPYAALLAGSITAWAINFTGARFLVFGGGARRIYDRVKEMILSRRARPGAPARPEPGSSPR